MQGEEVVGYRLAQLCDEVASTLLARGCSFARYQIRGAGGRWSSIAKLSATASSLPGPSSRGCG